TGPGRRAARASGRRPGAGLPCRRSQRAPAMSRWLFDLGNTRLKCAPLGADGRVGPVRAIAHDGARFDDDLAAVLPAQFADACVASVAADGLRTELLDVLAQRCQRISLACTQARFGGVRIAYAQPSRLGVDRFLALLGAHARGAG